VSGRRKPAYSVWRKMERKAVGFEQLSDIFGFRVVVKTLAECYQALGIVHTNWRVVPGRFKDYISNPKQNDYRSIHTTVIGPRNQRQLQPHRQIIDRRYGIRRMRSQGRLGSPTEMLSRESNAYAWLRRTIELLAEGSNPEEFLEHTKLELFHDQVFCFTPKGKLIALPRNATPIDFAYAVHTDIGNHAVGSKINGKIAPLVSTLQNGDEVEILTSKAQAAPPAAWESTVVTGKARAAIRPRPGWRCATIRRPRTPAGRAAVPCALVYSTTPDRGAAAARARKPRLQPRPLAVANEGGRRGRCIRTTRRSGCRLRSRRSPIPVGSACSRPRPSCSRCPRPPARSRSAASTAICRCGLHPTAARCRAIASSAS
jgi:hypothetical protein